MSKSVPKKSPVKVIAIVILLLIFAALGGGYLFMKNSGSSMLSSIPGVKAPLNDKCDKNDPELCKFLNNWQYQSDHTVITKADYGGMAIESTFMMTKDKTHMTTKQNGKEISNTISIGDDTYTLDYSDNSWWKTTYKAEETTTEEDSMSMEENVDFSEFKDDSEYKFIAKEACGDLMCFKYQFIMNESNSSTQFIWFDDKDYLLRKMMMGEEGQGTSESIYSYDKVEISAPTPVKEGSPMDAMEGSGYSEEDVRRMMQQYQQGNEMDMSDTTEYSEEY